MKNKIKTIILIIVTILVIGILIFIKISKIQYTKEFNYLPKVKDMRIEECQKSETNGFNKATYIISNSEYENMLLKYEKILKKDGWEITKDEKPANIEVKKNEHIARINVVDSKDSLTVLIWTK